MQNSNRCCPWLSCGNIPVKKRAKEPIQLDLVEFINKKEEECH